MSKERQREQTTMSAAGESPQLLDTSKFIVTIENEDDASVPTIRMKLDEWFDTLLREPRSYAAGILEADLNQPQMLASVLYAAANITKAGTGTTPKFTEDEHFGFTTPLTGNIVFDTTNAKVGALALIKHNAPTEPSYPTEVNFIGGQKYKTGVNNYIFFRYMEGGEVLGWIAQGSGNVPTEQAVGGTIDAHTHQRLSVLEAIESAGSGNIITQDERDKVTKIFGNLRDFLQTAVELNTKYPTADENDVVFLFDTETYWKYSSGVWSNTGSSSAAVALTGEQIEALYEALANTNKYDDAAKAKVDALDVSNLQLVPSVIDADVTAFNDRVYHNTANSVYTDPAVAVEGKGYIVRVLAGTATIGGVAYVAGDLVTRLYVSAAWVTRVYQEPAGGGGGGGGGWEFIAYPDEANTDGEISGTEASINFTGLDASALNFDESYIILVEDVAIVSSSGFINVRFNSLSASSSYKDYGGSGTGSSIATTIPTAPAGTALATGRIFIMNPKDNVKIGVYSSSLDRNFSSITDFDLFQKANRTFNNLANITEINLISTSSFTQGRFALYKAKI